MSTINGLATIREKQPIVATHVGAFSEANFQHTLTRYELEASTHVRPSEVTKYKQRLVEAIKEQKTPVGCLVAPFGYGKTSTMVDIWHGCNQANVLAIPPFSCNSVAEMGAVVTSVIRLRLANSAPALVERIQSVYEAYLVSSATQLAKKDSERYNIDFDAALQSIEDKIQQGYLHLEASAIHLLTFLEQATEVVVSAGFDGILILIDEFQQFLGNLNKAIITNFRTLIWGLKTRANLPLGLVFTMDPDTERNLSERAGDILHRIKENGFYLDFSAVYDREFPRLLWGRYASEFGYEAESERIVDRATLEALGQISERTDLSNGPRTIIDVFQRIAAIHPLRQRSYTPIDLIDDFLNGAVKFDGDQSLLPSLVAELIGYDYIRRVPERSAVLKLIAAFPRGCPREVARYYQLETVYDYLIDELRGDILTQLPEGFALIDLQRVGKPQNKLKIILKKYWLQITEQELIADKAILLFSQYIVPIIFPPFKHILMGWRELRDGFTLTPAGSYLQIYEGTFFKEFPLRKVAIQVCGELDQASDLEGEGDLNLIFVIQGNPEAIYQSKHYEQQRTIVFYISCNQPFARKLPRDVRWVEEYLRPVKLTLGVLLSLIAYVVQQAPLIENISEAEQSRITDTLDKLQEYLLVMIFGPELLAGLGITTLSRGSQALRDVLFHVFSKYYPTYQTLLTSVKWEASLQNYLAALSTLDWSQKRGLETLSNSKAAIAARFSFHRHAGFESQVKQLGELLVITEWHGNEGSVRFQRHAGENYLLGEITRQNGLDKKQLQRVGQQAGYLPQEVNLLIELLVERNHIQLDLESGHYHPAKSLSKPELETLAHEIGVEIRIISQVSDDLSLKALKQQIEAALVRLAKHQEDYIDTQARLLELQEQAFEARGLLSERAKAELENSRRRLYELVVQLEQDIPLSNTGLSLDAHINGAQRELQKKNSRLIKRLNNLIEEVTNVYAQFPQVDSMTLTELSNLVTEYQAVIRKFQEQNKHSFQALDTIALHGEWVNLVDRLKRQLIYMEIVGQIIDPQILVTRLEAEIAAIEQDLSTQGLKHYQEIYDSHGQSIATIADEISTAVELAKVTQAGSTSARDYQFDSKQIQIEDGEGLFPYLNGKLIPLREILDLEKDSITSVVSRLLELETSEQATVYIKIERKRNPQKDRKLFLP